MAMKDKKKRTGHFSMHLTAGRSTHTCVMEVRTDPCATREAIPGAMSLRVSSRLLQARHTRPVTGTGGDTLFLVH